MKKSIAALITALMMCGCAQTGNTPPQADTAQTVSADETTTAPETVTTQEQTSARTEVTTMEEKYGELLVELPPEGYDQTVEGVEYPTFEKYPYFSQTAGRETGINVMLPRNYDESKEYPVLYILHGFYDTEDWMARDIVALSQILTNLQDKGEAEEMIVVLPYIYCSKENAYVTGMDLENSLAYDNFINDLTTDVMPFIEKNFSASTAREDTAITGFSMGGRESLFIGITLADRFGYIGAVCPAPGLVNMPGSAMHPGQMEASEMVFGDNAPYVLLISSSKADGVVTQFPDNYREIFKSNGVEYLSHVMESTGHDHTSVKPHLYNFFRMLFK